MRATNLVRLVGSVVIGGAAVSGCFDEPTFDDPDGDPIPATLPEGVIAEVFAAGTSPVQTAEDAPPPPLELRETGGLAP